MAPLLKFRRWVLSQERRGTKRNAIARRLGCHPSVVTKLMRNDARGVSGTVAAAIESATEGRIRAVEWFAKGAA